MKNSHFSFLSILLCIIPHFISIQSNINSKHKPSIFWFTAASGFFKNFNRISLIQYSIFHSLIYILKIMNSSYEIYLLIMYSSLHLHDRHSFFLLSFLSIFFNYINLKRYIMSFMISLKFSSYSEGT